MTLRELHIDRAIPWMRYFVFADHFGHGPFWRFGWIGDDEQWYCGVEYKISPPIKLYELPLPPEGYEESKLDLAQLLTQPDTEGG